MILLDVMMPGIDGVETLRRIRERQPDVPVVMLSVVGKASTIVEAMQLGAADYLNKPFEEAELEATLGKVLERRPSSASATVLAADLVPCRRRRRLGQRRDAARARHRSSRWRTPTSRS